MTGSGNMFFFCLEKPKGFGFSKKNLLQASILGFRIPEKTGFYKKTAFKHREDLITCLVLSTVFDSAWTQVAAGSRRFADQLDMLENSDSLEDLASWRLRQPPGRRLGGLAALLTGPLTPGSPSDRPSRLPRRPSDRSPGARKPFWQAAQAPKTPFWLASWQPGALPDWSPRQGATCWPGPQFLQIHILL